MKNNIVLVGLMGSGKTSVGKVLALSLEMNFVDTDKLIEEREQKTIPEIFEKFGEEYFRDLETKTIEELTKRNNYVISTGGGAVTREVNLPLLKNNSYVIFLDTTLECIYLRVVGNPNRPLLANAPDLMERIISLAKIRKPLYEKISDFTVKIDSRKTISTIVDELKEAYIKLS